jgi:hypothetical protein
VAKWNFVSKIRLIIAAVIAIILEFYSFNFVPRNANIVASRSLPIQFLDYLLNFVIFFVSIYLVACLLTYVYQKLLKPKK